VGKLERALASSVEVVFGDLRDRASLQRAAAGTKLVFHCAGHVLDWGADDDFEQTNVGGTEWLLEAALAAKVGRVVHFSSIAVFGTPPPPRFDDDSPLAGSRDAYSRTKAEGERVVGRYAARGVDTVILRPAVVYGLRGAWFEEPLAMIEKGGMFLLGGGTGTCHPCYIENLLDAAVLAAEHPAARGRAYIVGDNDPIAFRQYFDGVASVAGRPPIRRSIPLPLARATAVAMEIGARATRSRSRPLLTRTALAMVTTESFMAMDRIRRELGFAPRYDFAKAIAELREQYAERHRGGALERSTEEAHEVRPPIPPRPCCAGSPARPCCSAGARRVAADRSICGHEPPRAASSRTSRAGRDRRAASAGRRPS
jgi:nucleoside-diphosphate-sugar epimerase